MGMIISPTASVWADVGVPLIIAFFAGAIAVFWPWLQALQRGMKFQRLIRRELEEIGPQPKDAVDGKPWWEHAMKRFVHEEIFRRNAISQNRDFLLSLNPTVVYQVSQLWIAMEKRDGNQWMYFLSKLATNRKVKSPALLKARDRWKAIMTAQKPQWRESMGVPSAFRQAGVLSRAQSLFERRFDAYGRLLPLTHYGPENQPKDLGPNARKDLADKLTAWFYERGSGLLLSGRAFEQFQRVRETLTTEDAGPDVLRNEFSRLRTDLKIDLGVRQPPERGIALAWPEDERW